MNEVPPQLRRTPQRVCATQARPPTLATGWFAIGTADDFPVGKVVPARLHDRELVVFRTRSGRLSVLDAHCPHLGAHIGHGGTVEGETVRCPFHGFRFDATGSCVATGYGSAPPRTAQLAPWHAQDVGGIVLVWADPAGRPPQWAVPELDMAGWSRWRVRHFPLDGHPQETTENSVDLGHLAVVHGYSQVRITSPIVTEGPNLQIGYAMSRSRTRLGVRLPTVRTEFRIDVWGFGWSRVDVSMRTLGIRVRLLVLAAQTGAGKVDLRIAAAMPVKARPAGATDELDGPLRRIPPGALAALALGSTIRTFASDVRQDFTLWQHKVYVDPPVLATGDGPIGHYRRWARQFYPSGQVEPDARGLVPHQSRTAPTAPVSRG